jgi:hypothetical protein
VAEVPVGSGAYDEPTTRGRPRTPSRWQGIAPPGGGAANDRQAITVDRAEVIDGVEVDYTSNELAHTLAGILGGNGNFLERVLGRMTARASTLLEELRPIARRSLSRRVHRHYRGFALNQLRFSRRSRR